MNEGFHTYCGHPKQGDEPGGLCGQCLWGVAVAVPDPPRKKKKRSSCKPIRFDKYDLYEKLGRGGMGVVRRAVQVEPIQREVALKRIRPEVLGDAKARRRFLAEAKIAIELRHPHIVPIYEVGEFDGTPFFTMKVMRGGTLHDNASRFVPPKQAAELIEKLARAVHVGHENGILHRDLKPANILFDERDEPHIADFGVAKRINQTIATLTDAMGGTIPYMAPEQLIDHDKRDSVAADIWSLGVILYELLDERPPFEGSTIAAMIESITKHDPPPFKRSRKLDRDLETIVFTCLRKEPTQRYSTAEKLAEDLARYLQGERIIGRPPDLFEQAVVLYRQHPVLVTVFVVATLALVLLTSWALVSAHEQEQARREQEQTANVFAARAIAGTVLAQVREYADLVADEARDPRWREALAQSNVDTLQTYCETTQKRHAARASSIAWWHVVDFNGRPRAQAPIRPTTRMRVDYSFRDYFQHARSLASDESHPVYVSRAYRSHTDNLYKVALVTPLRSEDGTFLGVLAAALATDQRFGAVELRDERRIVALTIRRDREPTEEMPNQHIFLVHAGASYGEKVVVESEALQRLTARRDAAKVMPSEQLHLPPPDWVEAQDDYVDRLEPLDAQGMRHQWLAGMAPVGHTELTVIV